MILSKKLKTNIKRKRIIMKESRELTEAEKDMIRGLKNLGLDKTTTCGIVSMLNTPEKMRKMEDYFIEEWDSRKYMPNEQEILHKLAEILKEAREG